MKLKVSFCAVAWGIWGTKTTKLICYILDKDSPWLSLSVEYGDSDLGSTVQARKEFNAYARISIAFDLGALTSDSLNWVFSSLSVFEAWYIVISCGYMHFVTPTLTGSHLSVPAVRRQAKSLKHVCTNHAYKANELCYLACGLRKRVS